MAHIIAKKSPFALRSSNIKTAFSRRLNSVCTAEVFSFISKEMRSDNEMCDNGVIKTVPHVVDYCPLAELDDGLQRLHTADEAADWLTS